ncbi:MAG: phage minor head protein, partial [Methylotenera sp.]|nr:phage minor head protein [Methylotenera sp.]
MDINYLIGLKPETAIAYLKSKGYKISFDWHEVWREAHHKAFTVAKAMDLDILSTIRNSVQTALDSGQSLHQFKETLKPELQKKGWWGKKEMEDPNTGEIKEVMLGSPHRLKTIYQTNLTVAYKVGQYKEQIENAEDRPYWMYEATLDSNTRPEHAALHGKVFRFDDPIWDKIYPPNDWGCRCTVRALKESQLKEKKLEAEKTHYKIPDNFQPKEWAYNPGKEAFAFDADYGKFNQNPSQPNFKDANRPSVKDVEDSYYSDAPEKLPTAKEAGKEKLLELLKKEFDLTKKNYQLIDT